MACAALQKEGLAVARFDAGKTRGDGVEIDISRVPGPRRTQQCQGRE
jgi:hypothetical protein